MMTDLKATEFAWEKKAYLHNKTYLKLISKYIYNHGTNLISIKISLNQITWKNMVIQLEK